MRRTLCFSYKRGCLAAVILLVLMAGTACRPALQPGATPTRTDEVPRLAIVSAFEPELEALLKQTRVTARYEINGRTFSTGTLGGREVVLFMAGVSMVNAAMNVQAAVDHFHLTGVVFSGIAGGVNPDLPIGSVVVPAEWAQYQEQVFARQTGDGWDTGWHSDDLGNFEMMFPQPVSVARDGQPGREEQIFWFAADPEMLDAARRAAGQVELARCSRIVICLDHQPVMRVGGRGVSGSTFVDNARYREWVWQTFQADALDMESAAAAHVAYANNLPFIAFRSLSDLAGGGEGENEMLIFMQLAAQNSAAAVEAFLEELN